MRALRKGTAARVAATLGREAAELAQTVRARRSVAPSPATR